MTEPDIECPHCNVKLVSGIALKESCPAGCLCEFETVYNWDTLQILDCMKCPLCGHSDHMKGYEP